MRTCVPVLMLALCLGLVGCASGSATMTFRAIEPVNLGPQGESRVTDIRIFQLTDDSKFLGATVDDLWTDDRAKEFLGETLIGEPMSGITIFAEGRENAQGKEVVIEPIETRTRYIGILAEYSQGDDEGPRFVSVPVDEAESVVIEFTGNHARVVNE